MCRSSRMRSGGSSRHNSTTVAGSPVDRTLEYPAAASVRSSTITLTGLSSTTRIRIRCGKRCSMSPGFTGSDRPWVRVDGTAARHGRGRATPASTGARPQRRQDGVKRGGTARVIPLRVVNAQVAQQCQGLVVLDELGDRLGAQPAGDVDHGPDDEPVRRRPREPLDELAVDLDAVELEVLEVVEGREPGAEVIEREPAAQLTQIVSEITGAVDVRDRGGLGELEHQPPAGNRTCLEQAPQAPSDRAGVQGLARDVDGEGDVVALSLVLVEEPDGPRHHPLVDL